VPIRRLPGFPNPDRRYDAVDNDFFAAPQSPAPPTAYAPPSAYAPIARSAQPARRSSKALVWIVGLVVLIAVAATAVVVMAGSGVAKHQSKTLDRVSLAHDATIQSDLTQMAMKEQAYFAENGQYGSAEEIGGSVLPGASGTLITVMYDGDSFCLQGAHTGTKNVYYYSSAGGLLPLGQTCS
jgi:hypothetical protein